MSITILIRSVSIAVDADSILGSVFQEPIQPLRSKGNLLYSSPDLIDNVATPIKDLILRILTIPASEAICESFGSKMEIYHSRFTHGDLDDKQIQAEFRVSELGPPIGRCDAFVKKSMEKYNKDFLLGDYAKFKGSGKVVTRKLREKSAFPWNM
jgi:hypothetical protein